MTILTSPIFPAAEEEGIIRNVTVGPINGSLGMYGYYSTIGNIDIKLLPVDGGNTYVTRAYSRTDGKDTWRLRYDSNFPGADPAAQLSESTFTWIDVDYRGGTMRLDFRLTINGGDIYLDSFGTNGFVYFNAPNVWDFDDVNDTFQVKFIP